MIETRCLAPLRNFFRNRPGRSDSALYKSYPWPQYASTGAHWWPWWRDVDD